MRLETLRARGTFLNPGAPPEGRVVHARTRAIQANPEIESMLERLRS
jgi:hypothetical protein